MKTMKGPGIFLAQFLGDTEPFNSLESIAKYMANLDYNPTPENFRCYPSAALAHPKLGCQRTRSG